MTSSSPSRRLHWAAGLLLLWLAAMVVGTGFGAVVLLISADDYIDSTSFQTVLCVAGGAFGASIAALLRAVERIAQGWVEDHASPAIGFSARLAPLLAVQPVFGAALGLLLFLLLSALVVVLLRLTEGTTFDPHGLLLVAAVAGLFARTLLTRLRDMFESLLGRARHLERSVAGTRPAAPPGFEASPAAPASGPRSETTPQPPAAPDLSAADEPGSLRPTP